MKKKIYILYMLIIIIFLGTSVSFGLSKNEIPSMIKIGLKFGSNSASSVNLHSKKGFEFGYFEDDRFYSLCDFESVEIMEIKKDDYYKIQVGDSFSSKEEMEDFLDELSGGSYYPAYERNWKIYIGLYSSERDAKEFIRQTGKINHKKLKLVKPNSESVVVLDRRERPLLAYDSSQLEFNFISFNDENGNDIITVDGKKYRGGIVIKRLPGSDMTVINYLDLEKYLYGVLPEEMTDNSPLEALKAQAVAARSYAISTINKHQDLGFNLCTTTNCQAYGGYEAEKPKTNMAVNETAGKVITYDGKIITPFYHANSGGYTEDSENVWSAKLPYIRGVKDDFSLGGPNSSWTKVYEEGEIEKILNSAGFNIGKIKDIYVEEYSDNGRVLSLIISDGIREINLAKGKTRTIFGPTVIKSMNFHISTNADHYIMSSDMSNVERKSMDDLVILSADESKKTSRGNTYRISNGDDHVSSSSGPQKYIFNGKGYGHGLGMSQWGAKKMAELGYEYEDILKHYYTGTTIE